MRILRAGAAALCLTAATAACSGSGSDTGSSGGWRVSGAHIKAERAAQPCRTPAPVLDTFSATPTPQPGCSPPAHAAGDASASPNASASPAKWQAVQVEQQYHSGSTQWKPIYTTYTAPPGTGVYQPMVHATNQPMPTPPAQTPTPTPLATLSPLPSNTPVATTPPAPPVVPSSTP